MERTKWALVTDQCVEWREVWEASQRTGSDGKWAAGSVH